MPTKSGCQRQRLYISPLKRGAGDVLRQTYTPLYPLFLEGNHKRLKFIFFGGSIVLDWTKMFVVLTFYNTGTNPLIVQMCSSICKIEPPLRNWDCAKNISSQSPLTKGECFKSPIEKGDSGGCVFPGYFTTPLPPLLRGILKETPFPKGNSLCHTSYDPLK